MLVSAKNAALGFTIAVAGLSAAYSEAFSEVSPASLQPLYLEMEREAAQFDKIARMLPIKDDCVPLRVGGAGTIDFQYLACSEEAKASDAASFRISENIVVPEGLAQRFNFWRRVYSLWSKTQYVIHVADFPEVVLEIHDSSRVLDLGDKTREKLMKPSIELRRREYQQILVRLSSLNSSNKIDESQLSQTELRIMRLFAHIDRKDKYMVAAQSLRVQRGQREYIEKGLETASRYLPYLEESFRKEGIPPEFARIAFIESSFNLQAMSKVGASGVYQIMPETGHDYLILGGGIDERNDPIKASRAAAKLLMLNYRILGQWPLAIAAYNHGVGGIRRAMQAANSNDIVELISKYDGANFGFASKNFYAGFLGLLATLDRANKVFPAIKISDPLNFVTVRASGMSVTQAKLKYKINSQTIVLLNPDISRSFIKADAIFPARYMLKVPSQTMNPALKLVSGHR
ncbi:MAG: lytic transglycosylase domain-containing protein [Proteobacteria bacterium]|nr:lytic transglycosylase domain-containing protein [Pseudomonadota bacterium]